MNKLTIKTKQEIELMKKGGKILAGIKKEVDKLVKSGTNAMEIEEKVNTLINQSGGRASFKMVPGYNWATCVNVNEGVVHGIPKKETVFKKGDIVSVDMGIFFKGFHTDTSMSKLIGEDVKKKRFLSAGRRALELGIGKCRVGHKVGEISAEIEKVILGAGFRPVKALTGHGIGRELHEDPRIPCFVSGAEDEEIELKEGMALAIEVMYTMEREELELGRDGWTISTKDGKMAALFEETVAVTAKGPIVLTT